MTSQRKQVKQTRLRSYVLAVASQSMENLFHFVQDLKHFIIWEAAMLVTLRFSNIVSGLCS